MKTTRYIITLFAALALCACEDDKETFPDAPNGVLIHARVAGQQEVGSRATEDAENGTHTAFAAGDEIGLYAIGPLKNSLDNSDVRNTAFKLGANGKWQDNAKLKWETGGSADIYGYYPYQAATDPANIFKNGGYNIFTVDPNKLQDILMAERTTVQNDNPAIFLTFKHRFALLKIKLGTGMEGSPETPGAISAIMNAGITSDAKIDNGGQGRMTLTEADLGITEFKPIKSGNGFYYVIVPVEKRASGLPTDSLQVIAIKVDGALFELNTETKFAPGMNTIYNLTVHKGEKGSVAIVMGGIEEWGSDRYLSDVREEGGIYWHTDVRAVTDILNKIAADGRAPDKSDEAELAPYATWDEDKQCFIFPVMRNIDMTEYANIASRNCCIAEFYGILQGNGYAISGLDITGSGFIGKLTGDAQVSDLELKNIAVNNGTSANGTGALVGSVENNAVIHNCSVTGTSVVKGGDNTGGLVGKGNPQMNRCSTNAEVTGGNNSGGLIGALEPGGSINQSYTTGTVIATGNNAGGLAGSTAGPVTNSHAGCDVTGKNNVGGLVGSATDKIDNCTSTGYIKGNDIVGGLVGNTTDTVNRCGANGTVTGTGIAGGLIGQHSVSGEQVISISQSYARSTVTGATTGGLIGNTTAPYKPEVPYQAAVTREEQERDGEGNLVYNEDGTPKMITIIDSPEVPYEAPEGTAVTNCYATNDITLVSNSDKGITYSYQIGTTAATDTGNRVYTIALPPASGEIETIIAALNGMSSSNLWVKGLVLIDGKAYTLPVLNYK